MPPSDSLGYISEADRFVTDVASVEKAERDAEYQKREQMFSINRAAANFFREQLWGTKAAMPCAALLRERGVSRETTNAFDLGYAPASRGASVSSDSK